MRRAYRCDCDRESHSLPRVVRAPGMAPVALRVLDEIEMIAAAPATGCPWRAWSDPAVAMGQRIVPMIEAGQDAGDWPAVSLRAAEAMSSARAHVEAMDREADRREREERGRDVRTQR